MLRSTAHSFPHSTSLGPGYFNVYINSLYPLRCYQPSDSQILLKSATRHRLNLNHTFLPTFAVSASRDGVMHVCCECTGGRG